MKKLSFLLMAMLVSLTSFAAALGEGYEKVTDISTLAAGDKVVLYCDDASLGVTGVNGSKDAAVAATGWVEYLVEAATGGVKLKDTNANKYISLTSKNSFTYATSGSVCKVNAQGVLYITLSGSNYFLYQNGTYYRMYVDKTGNSGYKPFYVYKVEPVEVDPDATMYTVTVKSTDETMGTVSGGGEYAEGKIATLEATPKAGYEFVSWSNGSTENPLKITVTENIELTATFQAQTPITIAEASKLVDATACILNEFTVTYVYKSYIHIQDASGYGMIYAGSFGLKAGDVVTGFTCSKSTYNGLPQFTPTCKLANLTVVAGEAPAVAELTTAPTGNYHQVVKLMNLKMTGSFNTSEGATLTATCPDGKTIAIYNAKNNLAYTFVADKTYNITGDVCQYSGKIQVSAYAIEEYVAPEPCTLATAINWDDAINAEANTDKWYAVNLASAIAAGKDIELTIANPGTEAVEITAEAYANCPATEKIAGATSTIAAGATKTTTIKFDEFLADQVEVVYFHVVSSGDLTVGAEAIEPLEIMPIEMTNLEVQDMGEFVFLQASDLNMTGISVTLGVYADGHLHEGSAVDWNGTELPIVEGNITKTVDAEKGDVYAGLVVVEFGEGKMGLDLTMYSAAVEAVEVFAEGATVVVNENTGTLEFTTTWEGYPVLVTVAGYEEAEFKEYEGAQISELTIGDDDNWYDFAVANVVAVIKDGNAFALEGEYTSWNTGTTYYVAIEGELPVVEKPTTITWELNGGELPAVVVPTNEELWEAFKPYYNTYYGLARDLSHPIANVTTFAHAKMQEIMTDPASEYKWLGDYVAKVTTDAGRTIDTEVLWRFGVAAFFNCKAEATSTWNGNADFTEAGKPENWGPAYQAANALVLPTEPVAEDYKLPTPTKEGYTFVGWYDNEAGTGEAYKVIPAGWAGTLYAIWKQDTTTALDNIAVEGKAVKAIINGQVLIMIGDKTFNMMGQQVK